MEEVPTRVTFRHLAPSPALQDAVREKVAWLAELFDGIVGCRVAIEQSHRHHQGNLYAVHVELAVPGADVVVSRSPDQDGSHADPYVAIRDAFDAARRQLQHRFDRQRRGTGSAPRADGGSDT